MSVTIAKAYVILASLCIIVLMNGCRKRLDSLDSLNLQAKPLDLIVYDCTKPGIPRHKLLIQPGTEMFSLIRRTLMSNLGDWKTSYQTYAPGYEVRSWDFTLNVTHDLLVLNYRTKKGCWRQVIRSHPKGFRDTFVALVEKETHVKE